jgi:hypothetical protein
MQEKRVVQTIIVIFRGAEQKSQRQCTALIHHQGVRHNTGGQVHHKYGG